jgi:hypothetical protein
MWTHPELGIRGTAACPGAISNASCQDAFTIFLMTHRCALFLILGTSLGTPNWHQPTQRSPSNTSAA